MMNMPNKQAKTYVYLEKLYKRGSDGGFRMATAGGRVVFSADMEETAEVQSRLAAGGKEVSVRRKADGLPLIIIRLEGEKTGELVVVAEYVKHDEHGCAMLGDFCDYADRKGGLPVFTPETEGEATHVLHAIAEGNYGEVESVDEASPIITCADDSSEDDEVDIDEPSMDPMARVRSMGAPLMGQQQEDVKDTTTSSHIPPTEDAAEKADEKNCNNSGIVETPQEEDRLNEIWELISKTIEESRTIEEAETAQEKEKENDMENKISWNFVEELTDSEMAALSGLLDAENLKRKSLKTVSEETQKEANEEEVNIQDKEAEQDQGQSSLDVTPTACAQNEPPSTPLVKPEDCLKENASTADNSPMAPDAARRARALISVSDRRTISARMGDDGPIVELVLPGDAQLNGEVDFEGLVAAVAKAVPCDMFSLSVKNVPKGLFV